MIQARWLIIFFAVLGMSIPSFAIDWSLGGFPSYMRTRTRVIDNATTITVRGLMLLIRHSESPRS